MSTAGAEALTRERIVVTGAGHALLAREGAAGVSLPFEDAAPDPLPWLLSRKSRKYMGLQDELAVIATGRALARAALTGPESRLGRRAGLYIAVGYIPFRREDAEPVLDGSLDAAGDFSLRRFGEEGFRRANPLLTFRCLPNMPAYHVSACFGLEGPYLVTYPGPGQLYAALEDAIAALEEGRAELALVTAAAHQRNFLVEHHFARLEPPVAAEALRDVGATLVLETATHAAAEGRAPLAELVRLEIGYAPSDVLSGHALHDERIEGDADAPRPDGELGPALLPAALSIAIASRARAHATLRHSLRSRDGITATSEWRLA
jgi:3-oxoacyl-(acyl-carrier-protein) synthase